MKAMSWDTSRRIITAVSRNISGPTVPMSLHGVIVRADGSKVTVRIGEDEGDPVFVVTDLLPHLAEEQYKRPATKADKGRGA